MAAGSTLPAEQSSFVGRAADLAALRELLRVSRLVTVLGPGGVGKTRLARRYAALHLGENAAWFCDLTNAGDEDGICRAVAAALETPLQPGRTGLPAQLGRAIAARGPALLVLDNFEQIVRHGAATVGAWLEAAPQARFLVTSRERLDVAGESFHELGPLAEGVELFVQRARAARVSYEPADEEAGILAALVERLDGMPLAIELAAARMAILSARQILERLPRRFELLAGSRPDTVARQATLRAAIDWSWNLLEPWERTAFAQCATFQGGFNLEAAERVLDLSLHEGAPWIVDVLQSLRDKSLLRADEPPGLPGEVRFEMYESIREYAALKLADTAAAFERHAAYFLALGDGWIERARTHGPGQGFRRLALEQENFRAVHGRAAAAEPTVENASRVARSLLAIAPLMDTQGAFDLAILDQALGLATSAGVAYELLVDLTQTRGHTRQMRGLVAEALLDFEAALALSRHAGDRLREAKILRSTAVLLRNLGRPDESRAHFETALVLAREVGAHALEGVILGGLGILAMETSRHADAQRSYEQALALHRKAGDRVAEGMCLGNLAILYFHQNRFEEARVHFQKGLAIHAEVGNRRMEGQLRGNLALFLHDQGELAEARAEYERALAIHGELGDRRVQGVVLAHLGNLEWDEGRLAEAKERYEDALSILREVGDKLRETYFSACLGALLAAQGRIEDGRALLDWADAMAAEHPGPSYDVALPTLRGQLDVALARQAAGQGDPGSAAAHLAQARRRVAAAQQRAPRSDDVRFALRILASAFRAEAGPPPAAGAALVVDPGGRWFLPPGRKKPVEFERRKALRLVFLALAKTRQTAPGQALSLDDLLAAGWPGERLLPEAGANRVYVALATLRKMGLKELLLTRDGGYLLDPAVPLVEQEP